MATLLNMLIILHALSLYAPNSCKMAASSRYNTRKRKVDYKKLNEVEGIPREKRRKDNDELYPIEIVERNTINSRVKIHYIGYSTNEDEWRNAAEILDFMPPKPLISPTFHCIKSGH